MQEQLFQNIQSLLPIDWWVTGTALIYVLLSARNNPWCWPFGIVSCTLWAYSSYFNYSLYSDALLQLFYVVMGFVGLYQWLRPAPNQVIDSTSTQVLDTIDVNSGSGNSTRGIAITRMTAKEHALTLLTGLSGGLLLGYFFSNTMAAATYYDAFTTSFSILATFLLVQRRLENWLYWIVIDTAYVGLYWQQGALLFAILMVIYVIIAGDGFRRWRKELN